MTKITKTNRIRIVKMIDANTSYDARTVRISSDGSISAKLDPDKQPGCHDTRLLVCNAADFVNGANPFVG